MARARLLTTHNEAPSRSPAPGPTQIARPAAAPLRLSGFDLARVPLRAKASTLEVNRPGDRHEAEADQVASRVGSTPQAARPDPPMNPGGAPIDPATRQSMESHLRRDFGNVRVHTNPAAHESADALRARAYTVGSDIVFSAGEYAPHTTEGRRLLAHELTHVVQQDRDASAPRLQRAEQGTYVSKIGDPLYLDAGAEYYKTWGFPNVQRISTIQEVLTDLDKATGTIDKFRIVSHGAGAGIETGLMPGLDAQPSEGFDFKTWFGQEGAGFTNQARFQKHWVDQGLELVDESFFRRILSDTRKDAAFKLILDRLDAGSTTPARDTPAGILLRAMVDKFYLTAVKDPDDKAVAFKNRAILDQFCQLRISTYTPIVVHAAPLADQPAVQKAIADFQAQLPKAFEDAGLHFGTVTADDAKTRADPYLEQGASTPALKKDIKISLAESAEGGGPFLKKLRSVQSKITPATHIEIRGCNVGSDVTTLDSFRNFFGAAGQIPSISAPDLYQYFFRLSFETFRPGAGGDANIKRRFDAPGTNAAQAFEDRKRILGGEMTRVVNETKFSELAAKYGYQVADLKRWNPEITDPDALTAGQTVWLVMRSPAPAGGFAKLKDFCAAYVGDAASLADVQAANPQIQNPDALSPADMITIPPKWQQPRIAGAKPTSADFASAIRAGEAQTAVDQTKGATTENHPVTYLDDTKAADSIGAWLAKQQFDPKGRTAAELSKLYAGKFTEQAAKTYMNFLSRGYPKIEDPIFPEDPRYSKHIIRRP